MLQSTHYNLKLAEGSDIVNPLVIDRPNYETIDGVMYENECASIGTATELKSGTIHALTRTKGNTNMFRFTATSNYDLGDTFTVDSVPVTALLPNGTAIPDKGYVVNSTVLCSLVGTLLTIYTSGSALADDSLKLGGELPTYYAKQSDMESVRTLANATSILAQQNERDIEKINNDLISKVEIIATSGETISSLIGKLALTYDPTKITTRSVITFEGWTYPIIFSPTPVFQLIYTQANKAYFKKIEFSGTHMYRVEIATNGAITTTDLSSEAVTVGSTMTLYYGV